MLVIVYGKTIVLLHLHVLETTIYNKKTKY